MISCINFVCFSWWYWKHFVRVCVWIVAHLKALFSCFFSFFFKFASQNSLVVSNLSKKQSKKKNDYHPMIFYVNNVVRICIIILDLIIGRVSVHLEALPVRNPVLKNWEQGKDKGDLLLLRNCVVHVFFVRKVILIIYKYCVDVAFEGHTLKAEKANLSPTCVF